MMHEVPWLWRFHATHHSAPRLYWLNAGRFHPLDLFTQQFIHQYFTAADADLQVRSAAAEVSADQRNQIGIGLGSFQ